MVCGLGLEEDAAVAARTEPGWQLFEIDASHNPHITAPVVLAELLDSIAKGGPDK